MSKHNADKEKSIKCIKNEQKKGGKLLIFDQKEKEMDDDMVARLRIGLLE